MRKNLFPVLNTSDHVYVPNTSFFKCSHFMRFFFNSKVKDTIKTIHSALIPKINRNMLHTCKLLLISTLFLASERRALQNHLWIVTFITCF